MIDLSDDALYDPQLTVNAQYLLAATFGLMQYGIINHEYDLQRGKMMRLEYDFGKAFTAEHEYHVFQQVLDPAVSVQVGAALDSYLLHKTGDFENSTSGCPSECQQSILQLKIKNMLSRYNSGQDISNPAGKKYALAVINQLHLFSNDSTIWGVDPNPVPIVP